MAKIRIKTFFVISDLRLTTFFFACVCLCERAHRLFAPVASVEALVEPIKEKAAMASECVFTEFDVAAIGTVGANVESGSGATIAAAFVVRIPVVAGTFSCC